MSGAKQGFYRFKHVVYIHVYILHSIDTIEPLFWKFKKLERIQKIFLIFIRCNDDQSHNLKVVKGK